MIMVATLALAAALQVGQSQDFRWSGTLASGKTIAVSSINGNISASPASGNQIEVTAVKSSRRSDPAEVEIRVEENDEGVTICTIYPQHRGSTCHNQRDDKSVSRSERNNDTQVDFEVRVPSSIRFTGSSVNGNVQATRLVADARVSTVNGNAEVATRGFAEASSVNGNVSATLGSSQWTGDARYSSVNGDVTVTLPAGVNAEVEASTVNGSIESDFPLQVRGRIRPRSIRGTIGSGGRDLRLSTVNGSIVLRKGA